MNLPQDFLNKIKTMLPHEYDAFLASYEAPRYQGIRLNPLKSGEETLRASVPCVLRTSPFSPFSFYCAEEKVGGWPAHHAGMFYAQEPSASSAVTVLAPQEGDRVLDLCAAPGGKSTQIAAALNGHGLLWSNEIVPGRAQILLSNIERMGVRNAVVSSAHPAVLCENLRGYFDKVLVDAPCSGEGMFKKEPEAIPAWSPKTVQACAARQLSILCSAAKAVKEGGILVYSTCTFSREENEDTVLAFLRENRDFEILPIDVPFGRPAFGIPALRIFPMDGGEGHFVCKMRRTAGNPCTVGELPVPERISEMPLIEDFYRETVSVGPTQRPFIRSGKILLLPDQLPVTRGINILRAGVLLGEIRGKRLEPAHAFFMSRSPAECRRSLRFAPESPELAAYLRGEEIDAPEKGYTAVCTQNAVTGFGKASGGRLKNKYPKGLRIRK